MAKKVERAKGILLLVEQSDQPYLSRLGGMLSSVKVKVYTKCPDTITEIVLMARKAGLDKIICTREDVLKKLLPPGREKKAKLSNYAGSIIPYEVMGEDMEFLILSPLKHLVTVSYGEFLAARYISKLTHPDRFPEVSEFNFKILNDALDCQMAYDFLKTCDIIGVDIETVKEPRRAITMVGYTGKRIATNESFSYVLPMKSMDAVHWMRKINDSEPWKVMQNGKYDCAYFHMYSAPPRNYLWDTANAFHAWYCELPKDLAMITGFFVRNSMYWKDLASTGDFIESCRYNALDTWGTVESFLAWIKEAPDWAKRNYVMEFSIVPGAHMCEMTGIKRDMKALHAQAKKLESSMEESLSKLRKMTGVPNFNPSSPKQVLALMKILGDKKAESSDEKSIQACSYLHPLNERILTHILDYRGQRKLLSTYLPTGADGKEFGPPGKERILYSLNPHGTDTGRLASKEHHFWCGLQIQNIPQGPEVKSTLVADEGYELWECDLSQAEDRGVAFNSGDPTLLEVFSSGKDSHKLKASMFFGTPYDEITKDQRNLGKRINHGANYNMGAYVLVQTMGPKEVRKAQQLLGLPKHWSLKGVAEYLLNVYDKTFPTVKGDYYNHIIKQVKTTKLLVGATGWTRYCFGDPTKNKMDLNGYVAHVTQSLNAMNLNKAFLAVFRELGFLPEFKLLAQIHDSLFFMTKKGHDHLAHRVAELMTFPVLVTDCKGVTREMVVPVDIKKLGRTWAGED